MGRFSGNTRFAPPASLGITVVCVAQFVVVLDATIVTTALPAVGASLGLDHAGLSWVITAYTLVFGALLVPCGRVADLLGPRRAFTVGLVVFGAASGACALAWASAPLVAARAVQGLGAALLSPAALALLTALSEPGPARRRAVGWWTAAAAGGGASGWVLGGLFTEYLGWRAVFWVNLPIAVLALAATALVLPRGRRRHGVRPDPFGALVVTAALGLLVYGLTGLAEHGPVRVAGWLPLLLAVGVTALLVRHLRRARDPVVAPWLVRMPTVAGASLAALLLTAATSPAMYLATLYVQQVLRYPPARAALLFPAFNLAVVAGSLAGPAALRRLGARGTLLVGFAAVAAGAALLTTVPGAAAAVARLVAAFVVMGLGLGVASVASTHAGTEPVDPEHQGVAAGVLTAAAQVGTAVGLAILAPLAAGAGLGSYRVGFAGAGALALVGLATARPLGRAPDDRGPAPTAVRAGRRR